MVDSEEGGVLFTLAEEDLAWSSFAFEVEHGCAAWIYEWRKGAETLKRVF